jgi:DNA-binding CsgD family transcriptional regulator
MRVSSDTLREERKIEEKQDLNDRSNLFVFCEKTTGVAQFRAGSASASEFSLDRIAGLFAMQCLVRGYDPNDFLVLVPAQKEVVGKLVARAKDLLEEGRSVAGPATLSPRQKEILHSVVCNCANKEIASKLNITVRTVKFHISSLLSKFGVDNRTDLARRAAGLLRPAAMEAEGAPPPPQSPGMANGNAREAPRELGPRPARTGFGVDPKSRAVRFSGRAITA